MTEIDILAREMCDLEWREREEPRAHQDLYDRAFELEGRIIAERRKTLEARTCDDHPLAVLHRRVLALHDRHIMKATVGAR